MCLEWPATYQYHLDVVNCNKETPLHLAAAMNKASTVSLLLNLGADCGVRDIQERTARDVAILTHSTEALTEIRLFFGEHIEDSNLVETETEVLHRLTEERDVKLLDPGLSQVLHEEVDRKREETAVKYQEDNTQREKDYAVRRLQDFMEMQSALLRDTLQSNFDALNEHLHAVPPAPNTENP